MATAAELKEKLVPPKKAAKPVLSSKDFLSTGSRLFNLALSGRIDGGFAKGTYNLFVGTSKSGKSLVCHNCLAEAAINETFNKHKLIYDVPEQREFWEVSKLWGESLARRIQPPARSKKGRPVYSRTIEDFYYHLDDLRQKGDPVVFVEDSMASLSSIDEEDKFQQNKEEYRNGKDLTGSYGDGKAKKNSAHLRRSLHWLEESGSILIIVNQLRDRIKKNPMDFGPAQIYAGGRSLRFYAAHEIWSSVVSTYARDIGGKPYIYGSKCRLKVEKNSINGRERTVDISVYDSVGVDDVGSCVDYLIETGHWQTKSKSKKSTPEAENGDKKRKKESSVIVATELDLTGKREALIQKIEEGDLEQDLYLVVQKRWNEIEEELKVIRKPRYT